MPKKIILTSKRMQSTISQVEIHNRERKKGEREKKRGERDKRERKSEKRRERGLTKSGISENNF